MKDIVTLPTVLRKTDTAKLTPLFWCKLRGVGYSPLARECTCFKLARHPACKSAPADLGAQSKAL